MPTSVEILEQFAQILDDLVQRDQLDFVYLKKWAVNLGIGELLKKAMGEAA